MCKCDVNIGEKHGETHNWPYLVSMEISFAGRLVCLLGLTCFHSPFWLGAFGPSQSHRWLPESRARESTLVFRIQQVVSLGASEPFYLSREAPGNVPNFLILGIFGHRPTPCPSSGFDRVMSQTGFVVFLCCDQSWSIIWLPYHYYKWYLPSMCFGLQWACLCLCALLAWSWKSRRKTPLTVGLTRTAIDWLNVWR